jgi:Ca-activated chloride channel family protein
VPPHTLDGEAAIADAQAVTAPLADPRETGPLNPVTIEIHLQPGFPIANLSSPHHPIAVEPEGAAGASSASPPARSPADRDFELRWRSAAADATVGLFRERLGGQDHLLAMLTPPVDDRRRPGAAARDDLRHRQ